MVHDPMDTVIGTSDAVKRDIPTAQKHIDAARKAEAINDRPAAIAEYRRAVAAVLVTAADPATGGQRRGLGDPDQFHGQVAIGSLVG